jgi:hypothetical protein
MIDQLQSQQEQTATKDTAVFLEEHPQTFFDTLLTMQALQLEVAQSFWLSWMELLMLPWKQSTRQQETSQGLLTAPVQPYVDLMLAPLRFSRMLVETSLTAKQDERERIP